jgi:hypothetical protein
MGGATSEDLSITAGSNLWTFASSTSATFAFTPAVAITGSLTAATDIVLTSATAGVRLTGGNGLLTIKGEGDGTDEDLTINLNSSNAATISSSTGVTSLSFSALNLATTGTLSAGVLTPVIDDPDNFAANFTGGNLYGGTFICNAAGTAALPNAAVGMNFTVVLEGTGATVLEPLATGTDDQIYLNGTALTQGHNIISSTSGAMCVFQYRAADKWMATCNGFVDGT